MTPAVQAMLTDGAMVPTAPLDEFLAAYAEDDNLWWRISCGHHQNLFDAAVERYERTPDRVLVTADSVRRLAMSAFCASILALSLVVALLVVVAT
jgi:hypothetical protein